MRVMVDADGYAGAADAFRDVNHLAVLVCERIERDLAGSAAMAGNDATSHDFASSYDDAAREAVTTIADLAAALACLGRLTTASSRNHRDAEDASTIGGRNSEWSVVHDHYVDHLPAPPPSSLGAQEPSFGAVDRWILDHVEGFVWPGASPDRLRAAAGTWATGAGSVRSLTDGCRGAAGALAHLVSPEIPLALDAVTEVRSLIEDTADQLDALARACHEYADAVEAAHAQTRALLAEIAQMVVEGMVLSAAVAVITGGAATPIVAGATIARVAAASPRFAATLLRLSSLAADAARTGRTAHASLTHTRSQLAKFLKLELRNERGAVRVPGAPAPTRQPGWLRAHELPPGHTLEKHVGKTVEELADRSAAAGIRRASSFASAETAERFVGRVLKERATEIQAWQAANTGRKLELDLTFPHSTGMTVNRAGEVLPSTSVRVVLIPSEKMDDGWQILTAFPT